MKNKIIFADLRADQFLLIGCACLMRIKELLENNPGEVDLKEVAYLSDRVCLNLFDHQVYGTQCHQVKGKHVPWPIWDRRNLARRRRKMGLAPLEQDLRRMDKKYPSKKPKKMG